MGMRKRIAFALVLVIFVSMLMGCSGEKKLRGTNDGKEKITGEIRYVFWDKGQLPYFEKCVSEFNKHYPEIKVRLDTVAWEQYWQKLERDIKDHHSADVFWLNGPSITKYVKEGALLSLDSWIKEAGIELSNYPEALVKLYNVEGLQYAIPKDFDTVAVWYNKAIFDAAGVPYPTEDWTWEEMFAMAKQLTKKDKSIYGISAAYREQTGIYNTIFASGGYVISENKKESGYHLPETQAGIQCWIDLHLAEVTPSQESLEEQEDYVQFLSEKIAMHWNGSWFLNQVVDSPLKEKIGVVALPTINGRKSTVIHGLGNCIAKNTQYPEAAWKWVEFLASEEMNKLSAETGAAIPAFKGTAKEWVEKNPQYDLNTFIKAAQEYSYAYPASQNTADWIRFQDENMRKVFYLEMNVKEACDRMTEQMNAVLKAEK